MPRFFGIDPGSSGGIAFIENDYLECLPTPKTEREVWDYLSTNANPLVDTVCIEQVSGYMPGKWTKDEDGNEYKHGGQPASRAFVFGQSYGALRMALAGIGFVEGESWYSVRPQAWQASYRNGKHVITLPPGVSCLPPRIGKGDKARTQGKKDLRELAGSIFPDYCRSITLKTCDAVLLAYYCSQVYRTNKGRSLWQ